mgnify:CR=1 FL=1
MPKLKTRKNVSKRMNITKSGKIKKRVSGQAHFNTKESGKVTRNKRRDNELSSHNVKNVKRFIPYN